MKIIFISADLKLDQKPEWFDEYRKKYADIYPLHLTFLYPTRISDEQEEFVTTNLEKIAKQFVEIPVVFSKPFYNQTEKGYVIMLKSSEVQPLMELQQLIRSTFAGIGEHTNPIYKKFEEEFEPHMTVCRNIAEPDFQRAWEELKTYGKIDCPIVIKTITLNVLDSAEMDFNAPVRKILVKMNA